MTQPRRLTDLVTVQTAPNAGPMTLDGTNSYILRAGHGPAVVVDPGPEDAGHLAALADAGPVALILVTHRHFDHTEGALTLQRLTGAPVRSANPAHCFGADPLTSGERIEMGGLTIEVLATPGHTADSVCFHLPDDGPTGSVLTGDTILGVGTTVIDTSDGTLADYLASLRALLALGACRVLPAHGPDLPDLADVCRRYLQHREDRLAQVRAALAELGTDAGRADLAAVTDAVYHDVKPAVRFAAERSMAAQLAYLAAVGG